jgi:hypothetical protein
MAVNPTAEQIAIGGLGTEMAVYDMVTQKRIFQAKGAKKDFLGLQVSNISRILRYSIYLLVQLFTSYDNVSNGSCRVLG